MGANERKSPRDLHELLSGLARTWGRLSMVRRQLLDLEHSLDQAKARLRQQAAGVEALERRSLARLRAWLRGTLPRILEQQQADFVEALHHHQSLERSLAALREERDQLEMELADLQADEKLFSEVTLETARKLRAQRQDPDASQPPPPDPIEDLVHLQHDLLDLEQASVALSAVSHHLEAVHDALARIAKPGLLAVLSGLALLDLFESPEILLARKSFEEARRQAQMASVAVGALETVTPSPATLGTLEKIRDFRFLHGLYYEGQIARVLERTRKEVEDFREEIWELRNRLRTVRDGLLTQLGDLQSPPP